MRKLGSERSNDLSALEHYYANKQKLSLRVRARIARTVGPKHARTTETNKQRSFQPPPVLNSFVKSEPRERARNGGVAHFVKRNRASTYDRWLAPVYGHDLKPSGVLLRVMGLVTLRPAKQKRATRVRALEHYGASPSEATWAKRTLPRFASRPLSLLRPPKVRSVSFVQ
jgi:hypothetical protein